jgi:hypothetical protein
MHHLICLAGAVQFGDVVDILDIGTIQAFFHGYLANMHAAFGQRGDPGTGTSGQRGYNEYQ